MPKTFTFAKREYTLPEDFTVRDVSTLSQLLRLAGTGETLTEEQTRKTILYKTLQLAGYEGSFADFEGLRGATTVEMVQTVVIIGRAIGYYRDPEKPDTGEAAGEESP